MVSLSLPRIRRWGNLHMLCETPSAYLLRMAWPSPFFPRRVLHDVPVKSRFLWRPRLLTRV